MYIFSLETAKLLFKTADQMGLQPKWLNDYGLFEISFKEKKYYIFHGNSIFNTQLSSQLSRHKHLTRNVIDRHSLPNIPYIRPKAIEEIELFIRKHEVIIAKPVIGSGSQNIRLIKSVEDVKNLDIQDYIFEKFIKGREMRYLFFQGDILAVHEKYYDGPINNPKTVKRISYPKDQWDMKTVQMAIGTANALSLQFAAVDFIVDDQSKAYVLEVNSAPGLHFFQHPTSGPSIDIARLYMEATIEKFKQEG